MVFADAHFPGHALGKRVLRADGITIPPLLDAIAPLFAIASLAMMQTDSPGELDHAMEAEYVTSIRRHAPDTPMLQRQARQEFYARAAASFCILITGETRPYGNILLRKDVTL